MEQGPIVQGTDKSRAKLWILPQRAYSRQEATGGDRQTGKRMEERDAPARGSVWVC